MEEDDGLYGRSFSDWTQSNNHDEEERFDVRRRGTCGNSKLAKHQLLSYVFAALSGQPQLSKAQFQLHIDVLPEEQDCIHNMPATT